MSAPPESPATCPLPPGAEDTDPLIRTYDAGTRLVGVRSVLRDGHAFTDFSRGAPLTPGRFSPFVPDGEEQHVAVLCSAEDLEGAISETVFHDVPVRGDKSVPRRRLQDTVATTVEVQRTLTLVHLTSSGLSRLGVARTELIESGPRVYPTTAAWARALHACPSAPDGLLWVSRQRDTSICVVLFGGRVGQEDVQPAAALAPMPLYDGAGYERVAHVADQAGITLTER